MGLVMQTDAMMSLPEVAAASTRRTGRVYYTDPSNAKSDESVEETDWAHKMEAGDSLPSGVFFDTRKNIMKMQPTKSADTTTIIFFKSKYMKNRMSGNRDKYTKAQRTIIDRCFKLYGMNPRGTILSSFGCDKIGFFSYPNRRPIRHMGRPNSPKMHIQFGIQKITGRQSKGDRKHFSNKMEK